MSVVLLDTLKDHLRVTSTTEDVLVQIYLDAAEAAVAARVQRVLIASDATPAVGTDELPVSFGVQAAILLFAAHLYENRTAVMDVSAVALPMAFDFLLAPHRVWGPETVTVTV